MPQIIMNKNQLPVHVGIIMDGNGRWAQKRNLPRTIGHKTGVDTAKSIIKAAADIGIKYLSLYTFSTENWSRPKDEVAFLMDLLSLHLKTEQNFYKKEQIRLLHIGELSRLSENLQKEIVKVINDSKNNTRLNLTLAINYGGKDEIIRSINKILKEKNKDFLTENEFNNYLDCSELPDVDLIIRTGGEKRLSNFLLWQSSYSELEFVDKLWPDYTKDDFYNSINEYTKRCRRYGNV